MKHRRTKVQVDQRRHRFFDNKYLALLATFLMFVFVGNIMSLILAMVLGTGGVQGLMQSIAMIIAGILMTLWFYWSFRQTFDGYHRWVTAGLVMVAPALLFVLVNCIDVVKIIASEGIGKINPILMALVMGFGPGLSEEVAFRGISGGNWQRVSNTKGDILPNVLATSFVFGLVHGINALAGAAISTTIFQMCYAFALGVLFEAVYLRCGSILPTVIAHTLIDLTAFLALDISKLGIITEELTIDLSFFLSIAASLAVVAWGLYLVRPAKRDEIVALWDRKWHKAR